MNSKHYYRADKRKNVSFCVPVAYDHRLLPVSIAAYHDAADEVLVGLQAAHPLSATGHGRATWSGTIFELDRAELVDALAAFPKVRIIEGDFYDRSRTPMENDCREREYLASQARNEWVVEIDCDELVDGAAVVAALESVPEGHQLFGFWKEIVKVVGDTALLKDTTYGGKLCALATKSRKRVYARQTGQPIHAVNIEVEHLTTARPESELAQKLRGWGHSDTTPPNFLEYWRALDVGSPGFRAVPLLSLRWGANL